MKIFTFFASTVFFVLYFILSKDALSWEDTVTHKNLSRYAAGSSVLRDCDSNMNENCGYLKHIGFDKGLELETLTWTEVTTMNDVTTTNKTTTTIVEWIAEGGRLEDAGNALNMLVNYGRSTNHFHNPLKPWSEAGLNDVLPGKSSLLWAQDGAYQQGRIEGDWSWRKVREYYHLALTSIADLERQTNFAKTFRGLGHQVHLLQDKAVPYHVRNDAHPLDSALGKNRQFGTRYFETWAKETFPKLKDLKAFAPNPIVPMVSLNTSYDGLVPITQFTDTKQYNGTNPSTGLAIGLAEYTNANFFSDETLFAAEMYSPGHKHYFPYPKQSSTNLTDYLNQNALPEVIYAEDGVQDLGFWIQKTGDGETITHFVKPTYWTAETYEVDPSGSGFYKKTFYLDEKCHEDYAKLLIPRAVGYSAGLLNYFFRGQIDMVADPSNPGEYLIKNLSNENMSGTFSLYYDDKNDNRILITSWENLSINANSQSAPVTFTEPASPEPKEKGKYLLVFQGAMGNETGAVAGKAVALKKEIDARMVIVSRYDSTNYVRVATKNNTLHFQLPQRDFGQPQAVRFDLDNPDEFVVVTLQADNAFPYGASGVYKFHKFMINESLKTLEYKGVVSSIPAVSNKQQNCSEVCSYETGFDSEACGGSYYFTKVHDCTNIIDSISLGDLLVKGGLIKPFGLTKYAQTKNAGDDYYAWNSTCTELVPMGWGYSLTYEYNVTTGIYFGSEVKSMPFNSRGSYSVDPECYIGEPTDAERPPYYWPIAVFNESDYAYGYNNESILSLPLSFAGQKIKKTMLRKNEKYSFTTSSKSYASEIGVVDCTGFLIGENRIGVRVDTWGASVVKFNSCSNWETLFSLTGTSLYPENRYLYDVILFY